MCDQCNNSDHSIRAYTASHRRSHLLRPAASQAGVGRAGHTHSQLTPLLDGDVGALLPDLRSHLHICPQPKHILAGRHVRNFNLIDHVDTEREHTFAKLRECRVGRCGVDTIVCANAGWLETPCTRRHTTVRHSGRPGSRKAAPFTLLAGNGVVLQCMTLVRTELFHRAEGQRHQRPGGV